MRVRVVVAFVATTACSDDTATNANGDVARVSFVNGFGADVDLLIDGEVHASNVAIGAVTLLDLPVGARDIAVREAGSSAATSLTTQVMAHATAPIAALRGSGGALVVRALEDSSAVVPPDATKLRVLHLAARAGEVQVWRTQPDYQTPIRWAFPFVYNSVNSYYQSSPGTWEVRVWTDSATSWTTAVNAARLTLLGGGKKTVAILDRPAGGIKLEVID